MNIGNAIKEIRKNNGMSQTDLSEAAGITQAALSQIENGKRPGKSTIKKICDALHVSESLLLVMSLEKDDVPKDKALLYETIFPVIKGLVLQLAEK